MTKLLDWEWGGKNKPPLPPSGERGELPAHTAGASTRERLNTCMRAGHALVKKMKLSAIKRLLTSERTNNRVSESEREKAKATFYHHQFEYCPGCGKWYELQWESDGSQILNKAEFQVICVRCGEVVKS
jgi:hypothetical protein